MQNILGVDKVLTCMIITKTEEFTAITDLSITAC
jgi:hypothetical protein